MASKIISGEHFFVLNMPSTCLLTVMNLLLRIAVAVADCSWDPKKIITDLLIKQIDETPQFEFYQ